MKKHKDTANLRHANLVNNFNIIPNMNSYSNSEYHNLFHGLTERIKELNCLYGISKLIETSLSLEEILSGTIKIIPMAWQYPEIACTRIELKNQVFTTENFKQTKWKQSETILVDGQPYGKIEVFYLEETPECDEGPFLQEERYLIHAIAERLGHIIERKLADNRLKSLYKSEKELRQKLQEEMQNKVEFTRRLIHELKTPLTSLLATSQLLYEEVKGKRLGKLSRYVWENTCRMNKRIDELHDMIKGEISNLEMELKPLDLKKLLLSTLEEAKIAAQQSNMKLELMADTTMPKVYADATRVKQILLNLLNNAFKYASNSGKVVVKTKTDAECITVEIQDHGPGIKLKEQQRIFEPYYRSPQKVKNSHGLGIGLALCRVLVEAHGGKIWVNSQPGKGSSFFFTLKRLNVKKSSRPARK
jgi:signal transduction histidine kinase